MMGKVSVDHNTGEPISLEMKSGPGVPRIAEEVLEVNPILESFYETLALSLGAAPPNFNGRAPEHQKEITRVLHSTRFPPMFIHTP
jgi:hypothetical protein